MVKLVSKDLGAVGLYEHNLRSYEKVKEALDYNGPVIVEVFTPITLTAQPKQVSYKREDGQMESMPLEYMNPPISEEEIKENMLIWNKR